MISLLNNLPGSLRGFKTPSLGPMHTFPRMCIKLVMTQKDMKTIRKGLCRIQGSKGYS